MKTAFGYFDKTQFFAPKIKNYNKDTGHTSEDQTM